MGGRERHRHGSERGSIVVSRRTRPSLLHEDRRSGSGSGTGAVAAVEEAGRRVEDVAGSGRRLEAEDDAGVPHAGPAAPAGALADGHAPGGEEEEPHLALGGAGLFGVTRCKVNGGKRSVKRGFVEKKLAR